MPRICFEAGPQSTNKMEVILDETDEVNPTDICSKFNSIQFINEYGILTVKGSLNTQYVIRI